MCTACGRRCGCADAGVGTAASTGTPAAGANRAAGEADGMLDAVPAIQSMSAGRSPARVGAPGAGADAASLDDRLAASQEGMPDWAVGSGGTICIVRMAGSAAVAAAAAQELSDVVPGREEEGEADSVHVAARADRTGNAAAAQAAASETWPWSVLSGA